MTINCITGISYLADINREIREGNADEIIRQSEWLQSRQLEEFAEKIVENHKKVVLIAGPSSSGKTTTAKRICAEAAVKPVRRRAETRPISSIRTIQTPESRTSRDSELSTLSCSTGRWKICLRERKWIFLSSIL